MSWNLTLYQMKPQIRIHKMLHLNQNLQIPCKSMQQRVAIQIQFPLEILIESYLRTQNVQLIWLRFSIRYHTTKPHLAYPCP
jgi:hypothetical protein